MRMFVHRNSFSFSVCLFGWLYYVIYRLFRADKTLKWKKKKKELWRTRNAPLCLNGLLGETPSSEGNCREIQTCQQAKAHQSQNQIGESRI